MGETARIRIIAGGPYRVEGSVPLSQDAITPSEGGGYPMHYEHVCDYAVPSGGYLLCRCGRSKTMPFCDGSHAKIGFSGEEEASREPYLARAREYRGPKLRLLDDNRCAYARFCHRAGSEVWTLTERAADEVGEEDAIAAAWECPTGRLVSYDRASGEAYEQAWEPSIIILEDVQEGCSGPLFVRGGVELVGADGYVYERRNRYALCRCGMSRETPFCDASHVSYRFRDGSAGLEGRWEGLDTSIEELPDLEPPHMDHGEA